ncbi:MAG: ThuA domain-containing protein [Christensenellaceae bacterium]|nr:ThuA domain-containing protein [Christensenellaceae bacterium]
MKKKAFLCSSFGPGFHPFLTGTDKEITSILGDTYDFVKITDEFRDMTLEDMRQYDCLMFYSAPFWGLKGDSDFIANLLEYIATGGSFLIMHIISTGAIPETAQVVGGGFRMHPPFNRFRFEPENNGHPILEGIEPFELDDEMHQVYTEEVLNRTILLTVKNDNGRPHETGPVAHQDIYGKNSRNNVELAWCNEFGKGRIVYACPGHNADDYRHPMLRKFLSNCGKWLAREI